MHGNRINRSQSKIEITCNLRSLWRRKHRLVCSVSFNSGHNGLESHYPAQDKGSIRHNVINGVNQRISILIIPRVLSCIPGVRIAYTCLYLDSDNQRIPSVDGKEVDSYTLFGSRCNSSRVTSFRVLSIGKERRKGTKEMGFVDSIKGQRESRLIFPNGERLRLLGKFDRKRAAARHGCRWTGSGNEKTGEREGSRDG